MSNLNKDFGIVILLGVLGTRQRVIDNIHEFLTDWNSVLNKLEENILILEHNLSRYCGYKTGIKTKDIYDNIQIFYPTVHPHTECLDLNESNSIWSSLQHSAELLTNLVRYGITRNIFLRGCISIGHIREYRSGYYSTAMIENADLAKSVDMIGVIAGIPAMGILNNKMYISSPRSHHFVKYRVPIKEPTRKRRNEFDRFALLNLNSQSSIYDNVTDKEIEKKIQEQIQIYYNNASVRKKWENTRSFINYLSHILDQNVFL
jgi:hypothetical protein